MNFILDKTYINKETDFEILATIVAKESLILEEKIDGYLSYYEFNVLPTGEIESIEFAIEGDVNQTFIKGFELQNLIKSHISKGVA